jgi:hypothetical protein
LEGKDKGYGKYLDGTPRKEGQGKTDESKPRVLPGDRMKADAN